MSFPPPPAPIAPPLQGQLALYKTGNSHYPYFTSGDAASTKAVVLIGGLTAGMGNVPYANRLSGVLSEMGWKLVQHHWSSAYMGFGVNNLDKDAQEMEDLVNQLQATGTTTVIFLGNSTGCQDIAKFLSTCSHPLVRGGILQAPVSDREYFMNQDTDDARAMKALLPKAKEMIDRGEGWEIVPRDVWEGYGGRLTYERFYSLMGVGGDDDYFSSDIPLHNPSPCPSSPHFTHPLSESFGRFSAPVLALWSEKDEFGTSVPSIPPIQERFKAWEAAMNPDHTLRCAVLEGADHEVHGEKEQGALMGEVRRFIEDLGL